MPAARTKTKHAAVPGTPTSDASSRRSLSIRRRKEDRAPLSDLPVNDDESERESRRKSGNANAFAERSKRRTSGLRKQVEDNEDAADAPDDDDASYGQTIAGDKKRQRTAGAALDRSIGGTDSRNVSARTKKARLSVVSRQQGQNSMIVPVHGAGDKAATPQVSMEVMSSNFEEWMKMATDNVSSRKGLRTLILTSRGAPAENHGQQHLEFCVDRLLCRFNTVAQWTE